MGKPTKHSKSHTSGLVPNSRGGRIDSRLAVSKNSSTMKSLSFNTESSDNFGVPLEVFSLSKMSRVERKNLKQRLELELEQVRKFQKKVASVNSNLPALSLSSGIISCSNGHKKSKLASQDRSVKVSATQANLPALSLSSGITSCTNTQKRSKLASQDRSVEVSATQVKNRAPLGQNDPKRKRSIEPMKHSVQVTSSNAMLMKQCEDLLDCLMSHEYAYIFNKPVDTVALKIPDYRHVIKHPMDLGTVKRRITSSRYSNPMDFAADVRLTFSNAKSYNPPGHYAHNMADTLGKYFKRRWKVIEKKIPVVNIVAPKSSKPTTRVETKISDQLPPLKKKKFRSNDSDGSSTSGSESDADKVSEPPSNLKENVGSVLTLDPGKGNHGDSETKKDSMNMIGQIEQSPHSRAVGTEGCLEGESASERQVSPEKLSRADLLRSRFADTILKAREKALEKDPYKPIIEREQHERRLKKGKAQLLAEAKAAKEAKIKAEAEAAAETKRKREQEREAARQALENMEKTIDISDNCQLLKDLEMLGLGYYVQVGSNPLEQLGLYLKLDEYEDENEELL
ncbi:hypothetical protein K1719_030403 [Acacia pycnantha]|nr:hypothetical protein K1719_030403 [Acacia pycnantha]